MKTSLTRLILACLYGCAATSLAHAETLTRTTGFEYEANSNLVKREVVEPDDSALCLVSVYSYDGFGNRESATIRNCNGTTGGGLTEAAAPTGDAVFVSRTTITAYAAGTQTVGGSLSWSAGQFPTTNTNALGHQEFKEFDPRFGTMTKLTGPNGLVTTWTYDSFGRKATESRSDGTSTTWTYTVCGTCPQHGKYFVTETSTGAPTKTVYLDSLNREIRSEVQGFDGTIIGKDTEYDSQGRVLRVSKPYYAGATPAWTTYQYDVLNRVTEVNEPTISAGTTRTTTSYNGLVVTVTLSNAGGTANMPGGSVQTRVTTKNSIGKIAQVTDTQGNLITYTYEPFGNLKTTNAGGVITTLTYDVRGRKKQIIDADMGTWQYEYNALSELVWQRDTKLQVTTMTYDKLGRMTNRTGEDLVSNWSYDACNKGIGKLCQATASNNYSRSFTYDSLGRVSTLSTNIDGPHPVSYTYDSAGRLDTTTYPTGFAVQNVYNARGYLWKVQRVNDSDTTVYWSANSVNAFGQVTSELLGNGVTTNRTYDALSRMTAVQSGTLHNLAYGFDAVGNVSQRIDNVQAITENFTYDTLNRLLSASGSGLITRSFNYNAMGNMTFKSDVGAYTYPGVGSARPHAVSSVTNGGTPNSITASYGYDANGSLISASGTIYPDSGPAATFSRTLTYTSFNMPATINETRGSASYSYTYTYNVDHERVRLVIVRPTDTITSIYLHPAGGGVLLYEKDTRQSNGVVEHKHFVNGGSGLVGVFVTKSSYGIGDGPQMRYVHRDHLGSVAVLSNPSGALLERFAYEAFGERRHPIGTPQNRTSPIFGVNTDRGFTAHEHLDELNLIHMNGRIYDPAIGRFMTADPFVQQVDNLQNYNRYSYAMNNPLMYTDPSGYFSLRRWFKAAIKALVLPTPRNIHHFIRESPGQEYVDRFVMKNKYAFQIGQIAATVFTSWACAGCGGAVWTMYYTELATGSSSQAFKAGAITFASSAAFQYLNVAASGWSQPAQIFAHGMVGGVSAELQGGEFKEGFLMSAGTKAAHFAFQNMEAATDEFARLEAATDSREVPLDDRGRPWTFGNKGCEAGLGCKDPSLDKWSEINSRDLPIMRDCSICRNVGNTISKVHDYIMSGSYSPDSGQINVRASFALNVYNFATMPITAAFTGFAHLHGAPSIGLAQDRPRSRNDE